MLHENLKILRKQKGFTQEELADKVHVVRQTVSKWEKGLSVPDAATLQNIAEVLEVNVNELLGADLVQDADRNEVAEQLSRINEQLAIRNRRWRKFWKILGVIILAVTILWVMLVAIRLIPFTSIIETNTEEIVIEEEN